MKIYVLLFALLLAGCIGGGSPTPTTTAVPPTEPPTARPEATATAAAPTATEAPADPTAPAEPTAGSTVTSPPPYPAGEEATREAPYPASQTAGDGVPYPVANPSEVEILGMDDLPIFGTLYLPSEAPQPWPVVLLLHMLNGQRGDWEEVATRLSETGYAVLAIDMRGHGDTGSSINWDDAAADHRQVINYLQQIPGVDSSRVAVMGASIGSNMALKAGADKREISTVILLSPGLNYSGVTTENILSSYGGRPILIVASSEDTYSAESSEVLADEAQGEARLVMYDGAGHGTTMFAREPGLIDTVIEWLDTHL